jgi:hypothetical protein
VDEPVAAGALLVPCASALCWLQGACRAQPFSTTAQFKTFGVDAVVVVSPPAERTTDLKPFRMAKKSDFKKLR